MTRKKTWVTIASLLLISVGTPTTKQATAAEKNVSTVNADTMIIREDDADDALLGCCGITGEEDTVLGGLQFMQIRGGTPFSGNSVTIKSLIRFDLGAATIDPDVPYFIEVETVAPGGVTGGPGGGVNSNDTFRMYAITDNALQNFTEAGSGGLTWNNSGTGSDNLNNFKAAGSEVGVFFSENTAGVKLYIPIMGSQIAQFTSGTSMATFGFTSTETNRMALKTKEAAAGAARLFTYDTNTSTGGGGSLNSAGTWSGGAPVANTLYRVQSGATVNVDGTGTFAGRGLIVDNGGTLHFPANDFDIDNIVINAGGAMTHSPGSRSIGNPTANRNGTSGAAPRGLFLNTDLTYNAAAGEDLDINLPIRAQSANTFTFNGNAGSDLTMRFPQGHRGTINFNGSGDEVVITEDEGIGGTLVMNSSGANTLAYEGRDSEQEFGTGLIRFDQPGRIDHRSTDDRLHGEANLEVNAPLTIDMAQTYSGNQRIYRITRKLSGSGALTVKGTASEPIGATLNELNISTASGNDTNARTLAYAGTLTTEDHVRVEARASLPAAKVIVTSNGELTTGYLTAPESTVEIGEIDIQSGGKLVVGGQSDSTDIFTQTHSDQKLILTTSEGQSGNLTLASGALTEMQINGDPESGLFDTIEVQGTGALNGTLEILINFNFPVGTALYSGPEAGETHVFDLITAIAGNASPADFDGLNGVDGADLTLWKDGYGIDDSGDADADSDTDGSDFLSWQRELGNTSSAGSLSGMFSTITLNDPLLELADFNVSFVQTSSVVQMIVENSALSATAIVPEPSSLTLIGISLGGLLLRNRRGQQ